ncbi:MAG TPA: ABC transporter permease [Thermoanaerobaculia bacterium]|nr:ABC transporter permease [Thermoanaerobaculia bacterium]
MSAAPAIALPAETAQLAVAGSAPHAVRRWSLMVGGTMVMVVLLAALIGPALAPYPPNEQLLELRLQPPSGSHPLGLDELGRDVLSRLLFGARVSLAVGIAVVVLAGVLGTLIGALSGYAGGGVDSLLMRLTDVVLAFPGILLAIALVAVLGPALSHVVLALAVIGWVGYARLVRGQVLKLREEEFVLAARAAGIPARRVVVRHVLPNVLPLLVVQATLGMAGAVLAEAGLSFLGLGQLPPGSSWGAMINAGRAHLLDAPHVALFPGLAIVWTVLGLNFLGDGLVDALDPRRRKTET